VSGNLEPCHNRSEICLLGFRSLFASVFSAGKLKVNLSCITVRHPVHVF
jgi:hypothetical protein